MLPTRGRRVKGLGLFFVGRCPGEAPSQSGCRAGPLADVLGWLDLHGSIAGSETEALGGLSTASHVLATRALLVAGNTVLVKKPVSGSPLRPACRSSTSRPSLGQ